MKREHFKKILFAVALWVVVSFIGSFIKQLESGRIYDPTRGNNCGKKYPIDYIFYNNLFCEIGEL